MFHGFFRLKDQKNEILNKNDFFFNKETSGLTGVSTQVFYPMKEHGCLSAEPLWVFLPQPGRKPMEKTPQAGSIPLSQSHFRKKYDCNKLIKFG